MLNLPHHYLRSTGVLLNDVTIPVMHVSLNEKCLSCYKPTFAVCVPKLIQYKTFQCESNTWVLKKSRLLTHTLQGDRPELHNTHKLSFGASLAKILTETKSYLQSSPYFRFVLIKKCPPLLTYNKVKLIEFTKYFFSQKTILQNSRIIG